MFRIIFHGQLYIGQTNLRTPDRVGNLRKLQRNHIDFHILLNMHAVVHVALLGLILKLCVLNDIILNV